jgi:Ca2+-binding EF-hand superfamily protein
MLSRQLSRAGVRSIVFDRHFRPLNQYLIMKLKINVLIVLSMAGSFSALQAQGPPEDPGNRPDGVPPEVRPPAPPPGLVNRLPRGLEAYDADEDGKLDAEEWRAFIEANKPPPDDGEEEEADTPGGPPEDHGNPVDLDGDGKVTREEVVEFRAMIKERIREKRLERFHEADTDEDGSLSLEEFQASLPDGFPDERAEALFNHCDADDDDAISEDEFLACLARSPKARAPGSGNSGAPKAGEKPADKPGLPEFLKPFDLNEDGHLDAEEIAAAREAGTWPPTPPARADDGGEEEGDE